jgi:hypothetical protein
MTIPVDRFKVLTVIGKVAAGRRWNRFQSRDPVRVDGSGEAHMNQPGGRARRLVVGDASVDPIEG